MTNATLGQPLARQQAAAALRDAHNRLTAGHDAAEACGWALAMLPESRAAQRLMLDWLLRSGQFEETATRTGALLHSIDGADWRLLLRRAEALLSLQRSGEALEAVDRSLAIRPHHRRGLLLRAAILTHENDHAGALHALETADVHHPRHPEVAPRLIESLLANDRPDDAAAVLDQMPDAQPQWRARTLRAQGRLLDARLVLEDAIHWELDHDRRDQLRLMHIDILEQAGDWPAIRALAGGAHAAMANDAVSPMLAQRLAEATLAMGPMNDLVSCPRAESGDVRSDVAMAPSQRVHVAAALAAANGADSQAIALLTAPRAAGGGDESPSRKFDPWLRALLGSIVAEQIEPRHARRAGADPSLSILATLLPSALEAFDAALDDQADSPNAEAWQALRDACRSALEKRQNHGAARTDRADNATSIHSGLRVRQAA